MDAKRSALPCTWEVRTQKDDRDGLMDRKSHVFFDTLYQQYSPRVLAYFRFRVGKVDVAEDLTSLVFERAFRYSTDLKTPDAAAAWLFRIAQNCAHDYFRRQRPEVSWEQLAGVALPQQRSSEEQAIANEERRSLLAHVSHLSEREQEIIGLKFVAAPDQSPDCESAAYARGDCWLAALSLAQQIARRTTGRRNSMKRRNEDHDEAWFAKLDAIVTGRETPTPEDDDVLHVAAKVAAAFSPLNQHETFEVQSTYVNPQEHVAPVVTARSRKRSVLQTLLTTAAVLFVLFGIVGACPATTQVAAATRDVGQQIWQNATSFEQIDASSLALLAAKKAGVRPLLPVTVPANTQSIEFGIITDETSPQEAFRAFVADYRIMGQDVSLYEQATNLVVPSSAAQNTSVNTYEGHVFQDTAGNSILQWYQDGMTCQMASTLPVHELLALARQFRPITQWELLV